MTTAPSFVTSVNSTSSLSSVSPYAAVTTTQTITTLPTTRTTTKPTTTRKITTKKTTIKPTSKSTQKTTGNHTHVTLNNIGHTGLLWHQTCHHFGLDDRLLSEFFVNIIYYFTLFQKILWYIDLYTENYLSAK